MFIKSKLLLLLFYTSDERFGKRENDSIQCHKRVDSIRFIASKKPTQVANIMLDSNE